MESGLSRPNRLHESVQRSPTGEQQSFNYWDDGLRYLVPGRYRKGGDLQLQAQPDTDLQALHSDDRTQSDRQLCRHLHVLTGLRDSYAAPDTTVQGSSPTRVSKALNRGSSRRLASRGST